MSQVLAGLPRRSVGGVRFTIAPSRQLVEAIVDSAREVSEGQGIAVHFANAFTVALADSDPEYAALLSSPRSICLSDGFPVAWFGRRFNPDLAEQWQRVSGPETMAGVLSSAPSRSRHYLLGGSPETLALLVANISAQWPEAIIAGSESPPFRALTADELAAQDERVRASGATLVWVGLGTPKQDWEVERIAASLPVVALAVGAAFDFIAGTKSHAPQWMRSTGLEWIYRWGSEPRRLTKRYLWGNPRFVRAALRGRTVDH